MKVQVLDRGEVVPTLAWGGQGPGAPTLGRVGKWGGLPAVGSFMGQHFLYLDACVNLQKTTSSSAWCQLGFEEDCPQDVYCLTFRAGGKKGGVGSC